MRRILPALVLSWLAVQTASAGPFAPIGVLDDHGRGGSAIATTRWQLAVGAGSDVPGVVRLYDPRTLALEATATAGVAEDYFGSAVAPLGVELAVGARGTGNLYVVRPDGSIRLTIPFPGALDGEQVRQARFGSAVGTGLGVIVAVSKAVSPEEPQRRMWAFDGRDGRLRWWVGLPPSTDGPALAVEGRMVAVQVGAGGANPTRRVMLFDVRDGRELGTIEPPPGMPRSWFGLALALDRRRLLVASPDYDGPGAVYQFRVPSGRLERTFYPPNDPGFASAAGNVLAFGDAVAFSRRHVAIGASLFALPSVSTTSGALYVYDRRRGTLVQRMLPRWDAGAGYGGLIGSDGHRLFVGYADDWDGMIDVFGPDRGE